MGSKRIPSALTCMMGCKLRGWTTKDTTGMAMEKKDCEMSTGKLCARTCAPAIANTQRLLLSSGLFANISDITVNVRAVQKDANKECNSQLYRFFANNARSSKRNPERTEASSNEHGDHSVLGRAVAQHNRCDGDPGARRLPRRSCRRPPGAVVRTDGRTQVTKPKKAKLALVKRSGAASLRQMLRKE